MQAFELLLAPDYGLVGGLVALFILLGILVVCIPRPRKSIDSKS